MTGFVKSSDQDLFVTEYSDFIHAWSAHKVSVPARISTKTKGLFFCKKQCYTLGCDGWKIEGNSL